MTDKLYFSYADVKGEHLARTGLNGWISPERFDFHFCARCNHIQYLKVEHYYDGTAKADLEGIGDRDYHEDLGGDYGLDHLYKWAGQFGWFHFINPHGTKDMMFSYVTHGNKKRCKQFARDWKLKPVFKD